MNELLQNIPAIDYSTPEQLDRFQTILDLSIEILNNNLPKDSPQSKLLEYLLIESGISSTSSLICLFLKFGGGYYPPTSQEKYIQNLLKSIYKKFGAQRIVQLVSETLRVEFNIETFNAVRSNFNLLTEN